MRQHYSSSIDSSRTASARFTPGPPACEMNSNNAASARGLAISQHLSSGACWAICHSTSIGVSGEQATDGVNAIGGDGGAS
ncbi:hypothetical protein [Bifidobacterium breve]|uniref:hypothetical protein n=1 Tax=Bifidobacterium breve TaxID=1685 RepID=UPI0030F43EDD